MKNIDELKNELQKGKKFKYLFFWGHRQKSEESVDKVIVEASPYDKVWGIGMLQDDEKATKPLEWRG
ncbi:MAG: Uncharacterized domain COG3236 / GTP cyclohydrolase II (EC [uncultured Sulfurovum sp.]|uniref:Uncharacterized domain COG3236 / GTP cyclohydrolase II (EC) n=1 Tax=uncultured Sulfurovum sp. TaxID=269237 RepID=A0A6S6RVY6_9BACT|nr:MAG: Uncharacterized domain COG3236 / GTP cyclohydrolase II (EC [uncultured Sulfurovum sp.]